MDKGPTRSFFYYTLMIICAADSFRVVIHNPTCNINCTCKSFMVVILLHFQPAYPVTSCLNPINFLYPMLKDTPSMTHLNGGAQSMQCCKLHPLLPLALLTCGNALYRWKTSFSFACSIAPHWALQILLVQRPCRRTLLWCCRWMLCHKYLSSNNQFLSNFLSILRSTTCFY